MSLDTSFESSVREFFDDFVENVVAGLVAVDADEEAEVAVVHDDWEGFLAELLEAVAEGGDVLIVLAGAAIAEHLGGLPAVLDVGFGDIEEDDGFDWVTTGLGSSYHGIFLAGPAADRGKNERIIMQIVARKIGQDPFIKDVGRNEIALVGEVLAGFGFFGPDDEARGEEFGAEGFGEADALSVFAGHREAEDVDGAGADPRFDRVDFAFHI